MTLASHHKLKNMAISSFKFSGEAAWNYDRYLGPVLFEPFARYLVSGLTGYEKVTDVLEIACGTGRVTRHLSSHFKPPIKLTASDLSSDMLEVAKSVLDNPSIDFRVEDAQNLSFPDHSFDLVICQFGMMFLADKKKGISEALRVLKPGGLFIFSTWDKTAHIPILKLVFNDVIVPYLGEEDPARLLVPFSLFNPEQLVAWMQEAGFEYAESKRIVLPSSAPSPDGIVNGLFVKHSLGQQVLENDPEKYKEMLEKITEGISREFGNAAVTFELAAFFNTGRKAK